MNSKPKIKLTHPHMNYPVNDKAYQRYVDGIKKLWENGRDQRLFVTMTLDEFKRGYLDKAYSVAKQEVADAMKSGKLYMLDESPQLLDCLGPNFNAQTFPIDQMEKKYFGLTDHGDDKYHAPSMRSAVTIMRNILENEESDNPKGTSENYEYFGFRMIDRGSLPPLPVVEFSDCGDWDVPLYGLHYPKYLPNGDWELSEYIPLTGNYWLNPNGTTWYYDGDDEYEDDDGSYLDCDLIKGQPTCNEFELVFKCMNK